jgi:hypothetical protein
LGPVVLNLRSVYATLAGPMHPKEGKLKKLVFNS